MSTIKALQAATENSGKCTKCGASKAEAWSGCPFDGFCPAPDYHEREAKVLLADGLCPAFTREVPGGVARCKGALNPAGTCTVCDYDPQWKTRGRLSQPRRA